MGEERSLQAVPTCSGAFAGRAASQQGFPFWDLAHLLLRHEVNVVPLVQRLAQLLPGALLGFEAGVAVQGLHAEEGAHDAVDGDSGVLRAQQAQPVQQEQVEPDGGPSGRLCSRLVACTAGPGKAPTSSGSEWKYTLSSAAEHLHTFHHLLSPMNSKSVNGSKYQLSSSCSGLDLQQGVFSPVSN